MSGRILTLDQDPINCLPVFFTIHKVCPVHVRVLQYLSRYDKVRLSDLLVPLAPDNLEQIWQGKTVAISGVSVADARQTELVGWLANQNKPRKPVLVYALHVGGLIHLRRDSAYRTTLNRRAVVYADGAGIVLLGRRNGGTLDRSPTTDLAPSVLALLAGKGKPARVALLGGPVGMAAEAGRELRRLGLADVVFTGSGYEKQWGDTLREINSSQPDILFVGMGAPREMDWCESQYDNLPNCVVITCGGWFGFLSGKERRAPKWAQAAGLEWLWRLAQSPRRLFSRYALGALALGYEIIIPSRSNRY